MPDYICYISCIAVWKHSFVTYINQAYSADTFIPNLEKEIDWVLADESDENTYFDIEYFFRTYKRK